MGFLNITLGDTVKHFSIKNNQLQVQTVDSERQIPLRDINSLIIESSKINCSVYALQALVRERVAVYMCDHLHLPNAMILPFNDHYSQLRVFNMQQDAPRPLEKQLWQAIVRQKILNQARCLALLGKEGHDELVEIANSVNSGDTNNKEAHAANFYWRKYFDGKYGRNTDCFANDLLNYGYSLVRGQIARDIVAHGLQPFMGIHHKNQLNAFNLADDLFEPFRPFVDAFVSENFDFSDKRVLPEHKRILMRLLNLAVTINGEVHSLPNATHVMVESFVASLRDKAVKIILPILAELKSFKYE
ncbi:MAG: type II CRISPR-associated endonuclease Cas1 [Firmicutes bacterium]|nr:type II CRISPR-associated endonuclease Cas1 [Bacillota bacterium]